METKQKCVLSGYRLPAGNFQADSKLETLRKQLVFLRRKYGLEFEIILTDFVKIIICDYDIVLRDERFDSTETIIKHFKVITDNINGHNMTEDIVLVITLNTELELEAKQIDSCGIVTDIQFL